MIKKKCSQEINHTTMFWKKYAQANYFCRKKMVQKLLNNIDLYNKKFGAKKFNFFKTKIFVGLLQGYFDDLIISLQTEQHKKRVD